MPAAQKVFATRSQKTARLWCIIRAKNHAKEQHHVQHRHRRFGPAGVSAALYAVHAGVQTTVLTKGSGALARAETIENYYGFAQPVSGPELERRSIENARRLGCKFVQTEPWADMDRPLTVETLAAHTRQTRSFWQRALPARCPAFRG